MHVKHTKLEKPKLQQWARTSIAFVGTNCGDIEELLDKIETAVSNEFRTVIVDADHKLSIEETRVQEAERLFRFEKGQEDKVFEDKMFGQQFDLALINGNHYPAEAQIVFLDSKKEDSLRRREGQLTNVLATIRVDVDSFDWLDLPDVPTFNMENEKDIINMVSKTAAEDIPTLRALVLAGGESTRMGEDKSQIDYHGTSQELYLARMCESLGLETYISKRGEMLIHDLDYKVIKDSFIGLGPYGAILSAFREQRNVAWLVIACDLPFLTKKVLTDLISERDPSKHVTAAKSSSKDFAEPLLAIYEPKMYPRMLEALGLGYSCPTKLLRNSMVKELIVKDEVVRNINTREERDAAFGKLK